MATSIRPDKIVINPEGKWRMFTSTIPPGGKPIGTITRNGYDTGALVYLPQTGRFVKVNRGVCASLNKPQISRILKKLGVSHDS
ncbi:hypothetical protein [Methylococcus sp. Mc7]|uniref:hypothetical protein n=1 Tax=Methylococcus sp. Mc7 TaxID=2860258 RepID=UPI001C52B38F|nr:hypothetical protein [Methylococcus sp. Mc7]QXP83010.1 hypothetical protein KW115_12475 [Methylococcus sp. Mc7]